MTRDTIIRFVLFFVYLFAQIVLFKNLVVFNIGFCFLYVAYLLLLPIEFNTLLLMALAFVMGFLIDIFYNSLGLHALALVCVAYLRNYWLNALAPQGGYDAGAIPAVKSFGILWFIIYVMPLIFVHHLILFLIEASDADLFWYSMSKVISSVLFTMIVILVLQYSTPKRRRI